MNDTRRRIAVTGASGYVGAQLVKGLEREDAVEGILAMDIRPPAGGLGPRVTFLHQDVSVPFPAALADHQIDTVVHLAYVLRQGRDREANRRVNIGGTSNLLEACAVAEVRKIVYLSSTSVYGARPDNPPLLTESSSVRPVRGFQYSEDKARSESLIDEFVASRPGAVATILRCCPVVGPNADNFISRAFLKPLLVKVWGADPPMQLVQEDDLTRCLILCALGNATGVYNVAGGGTVRWSEMVAMLGRRLISLPAPLLYAATGIAWTLRLQSDSPSAGLDFIRFPWNASTEKIEGELGVEFRHSSREAWESFARRRVAPATSRQQAR